MDCGLKQVLCVLVRQKYRRVPYTFSPGQTESQPPGTRGDSLC